MSAGLFSPRQPSWASGAARAAIVLTFASLLTCAHAFGGAHATVATAPLRISSPQLLIKSDSVVRDLSKPMRLDAALCARGMCESRSVAKRAVRAGSVHVNGVLHTIPSDVIKPGAIVELMEGGAVAPTAAAAATAAPTVLVSEHAAPPPMRAEFSDDAPPEPPTPHADSLRECGVDEGLWVRISKRQRQNLAKMARLGKKALIASRVVRLREILEDEQQQQQHERQVAVEAKATFSRTTPSPEEWFPAGAEEAELKQRFRQLARRMHPDAAGADPERALQLQQEFTSLQAEYDRLLAKCKTDTQRERLKKGWIAMGGLSLAVTVASPVMAAAAATAAAAAAAGAAAGRTVRKEMTARDLRDEPIRSVAQLSGLSVPELYQRLDECLDEEDYEGATIVKGQIDELRPYAS